MNISAKNKPNETSACCCVDMGSIIDNEDCLTRIDQVFLNHEAAVAGLSRLIECAKKVQSDPCKITQYIEDCDKGAKLVATFEFCCGAENLIFQLNSR